MIKSIKLLKINFIFALVPAALIFTACDNDFVQKALSTISSGFGGEGGGIIPAPITWNTNVVYVDPLSGTLSGTVTALLSNGGRSIWFAQEQNNKPSDQWKFTSGDEFITAGSLEMFIGGSPTVSNGNLMTLNFFSNDSNITSNIQPSTPVPCSFILYPDSLYGADRDAISIATATLNFKVEKPSNTVYAKYFLEKHEYGSISVSWAQGSESSQSEVPAVITAEMQRIAGSLAAYQGSAAAVAWAGNDWAMFTDDPIASVSWITLPNIPEGGGLGYAKYTIELSPIAYDTEPPLSPRISVPVAFPE
jgi:hypothetical protein